MWERVADRFASPTFLKTMGVTSEARIAMTVMTTRISMRVKPAREGRPPRRDVRSLDNTEHLLDRGDSRLDLGPGVVAQGGHSFGSQPLPNRHQVDPAHELTLEILRDHQILEDPRA